jgi:lipopolysaccharide/colanic/teichoic acid biosynthesis glycosyltransferase
MMNNMDNNVVSLHQNRRVLNSPAAADKTDNAARKTNDGVVKSTHPVARSIINEPEEWQRRLVDKPCLLRGRAYLVAKKIMDVSIVMAVAPLWMPVLLLCAVLIKLDSPTGPVLFKQQRTGRLGRRFSMLKFRTMVPNAEELKESLADQNLLQWPDFKVLNDPRITRIGRILRKTSLDELPQLLNVLRGDMSLVGPRPTSFKAATYKLWQSERLDVTPGITGLWQIHGRGTTEFTDRVRMDILYIENRCLSLDIKLLMMTFFSMNKGF